jgi:hypothetical protein
VAATLVVLGVMVVALVRGFQSNLRVHRRKALQISEYGLLQSLNRLQEEPSWRAGIEKTSYLDGWYTVSLALEGRGDVPQLRVRSVGRSGVSSRVHECTLTLSINDEGDSTWVQQSLKQE